MDFSEYYRRKDVVSSYDILRTKGLKGRIVRMLEYAYVDRLVGPRKKQKILEIGVGTGFISRLLVDKGSLHGTDISKEMLRKTSAEIRNAHFFEGNILKLRLKKPNQHFDKVVTIRVISHFKKDDAIKALKNINGALKEGGEAIFNVENISYIRRVARRIMGWGSTYNYQYSKKALREICQEAGLEIRDILYLDHMFMLPLHLLNKLLLNRLEKAIFKMEMGLSKVRFSSNNSFVKCKT